MLGAMPICSKKTTYNVTIKGEGWHGKNMFFFSPGGTVGGTNATRLHYCRANGGPFFCACLTLVGSHGKTGKQRRTTSNREILIFDGVIEMSKIVDFLGSSLNAPAGRWNRCKKGAVLTAKRSKWGRSTWLGWSDLVERLLSIREGTGGVHRLMHGWAVNANAGHTARLIQGTDTFAGGHMCWWCWSRETKERLNSYQVLVFRGSTW